MAKFSAVPAVLVCLVSLASPGVVKAQIWNNMGGMSIPYYGMTATDRIVNSQDTLDAYVVWNDYSVRVNGQAFSCRNRSGHLTCGNFFTGWVNLQGVAMSAPSAVAWGTHREVFVLGTDYNVWHNYADNTTWSGWLSLGAPVGGLCAQPSAVSWAPNRIDVFAMGCDNQLWHTYLDHGWQGWGVVPGSGLVYSAPNAISKGPGLLDVVSADANGFVWDAAYNGSSWSCNNTNLQGCGVPTTVPLASTAAFTLGCDNQHFSGSSVLSGNMWNQAQSIAVNSNPQYFSPNAVQVGDRADVVYLNAGDQISYQPWTSGSWVACSSGNVGSDTFAAAPVPVFNSVNGAVSVFAAKSDGSIWNTYLPAFGLAGAPASQSVLAGNSTAYKVTTIAVNGFSASVALSVTGLPPGTTGTFTPASLSGAGSSTLNITTSRATPAGAYVLSISGMSSGCVPSRTAIVTLVVTP